MNRRGGLDHTNVLIRNAHYAVMKQKAECIAISRNTIILNHLIATGGGRRSVLGCANEFIMKVEELNNSTASISEEE